MKKQIVITYEFKGDPELLSKHSSGELEHLAMLMLRGVVWTNKQLEPSEITSNTSTITFGPKSELECIWEIERRDAPDPTKEEAIKAHTP